MANAYGNQYYAPIGQNGPSIGVSPNPVPMSPANQAFSNTISNSIVWVETEDEAKNWMVGPNNRVFVFVGDNEILYVKEKNSDGRPLKTEIYDLNKRQVIEEGSQVDLSGYVKKEDVQAMIDAAVSRAVSESRNKNKNFQNHKNSNRNGGYDE
jgi:hypothetical protein